MSLSKSPPVLRGRSGLAADRRGAVAIMVALMILVLMGFVSLGVEIVMMLKTQRGMQSAADDAAISAALAAQLGFPTPYSAEAFALAAAEGFVNRRNNVTVAVNSPPTAGNYAGANGYVEVLITQPRSLMLAQAFHRAQIMLHGHAVAALPTSPSCSLALATSGSGTVTANGGASIVYNNCSLSANSTAADAVKANGGGAGKGTITATNLYVGGSPGYSISGGGSIVAGGAACPNPACYSAAQSTLNPYAATVVPPAVGCTSVKSTKKVTITPGCYNSISLTGGDQLTLKPGTYVINGTLSVAGGATLTCTCVAGSSGVTIFLTGSSSVSIASNSTVTLLAPPKGSANGGLLFYSNAAGGSSFNGGATMRLTGAIVMPNQNITFAGNTSVSLGSVCTVLIGNTLTFSGNTTLATTDCAAFGTNPPFQPAVLSE
jgi:hypothetical protein